MSTEPTESYLDYVQPETAASGDLAQLSKLAELQAGAEAEVKRIEAELNKAKEVLRDFAERQVPELMDQIGMASFKTASGLTVEVAETIRASIPKAVAPRSFAWLREHGHAALIKRVVTLSFGKNEDEKADDLRARLTAEGFEVEDQTSVHAQTLGAWVKEKLSKGEEIPLELFGVHRQRVSRIKV